MPDHDEHVERLRQAREWQSQSGEELEAAILEAASAGMTHGQIAEALGITRQAVSRYIRDRQRGD
jgi:predicted transcriptional regulator